MDHHLRKIPKRLIFHDLAVFETVEVVVTHMYQMPRRWNIEERCDEGSNIVPTASDPARPMLILTRHDNPVAPFNIRPGHFQNGQGLLVKLLRSNHIAKGMGKMEHSVGRDKVV